MDNPDSMPNSNSPFAPIVSRFIGQTLTFIVGYEAGYNVSAVRGNYVAGLIIGCSTYVIIYGPIYFYYMNKHRKNERKKASQA